MQINKETLTEFLAKKRYVCDNVADDFITNVINTDSLNNLNQIFKDLVYNKEIESDSMPKYFEDFFDQNSALPNFANIEKIELAQSVFKRFGPAFIVAYFCKSLPECYACGNGAVALAATGRLTNHTRRRIAQTAQFVFDVMSPGGLEQDGRGISSAIKVRLVHASIRYYMNLNIGNNKVNYNPAFLGLPINQEDLVGTMLAFSLVVVNGMEKLGIDLTMEEKESILHLWKVVGHLIGIQEEIMPDNYEEAKQIWSTITSQNFKNTPEGESLNNHLIQMLNELIPGRKLDDFVIILMNQLVDDNAKPAISLISHKNYNILSIITYLFGKGFLNIDGESRFSYFFTNYVNMAIINALKNYVSEGENISIFVPDALTQNWNKQHSFWNLIKGKSK